MSSKLVLGSLIVFILCACATAQHETAKYNSYKKKLFKITMEAIKENGFNIKKFDPEQGTIHASVSSEFRVALELDANVQNDGVVDIKIIPHSGIMGDTKSMIDSIHASIKEKILYQ